MMKKIMMGLMTAAVTLTSMTGGAQAATQVQTGSTAIAQAHVDNVLLPVTADNQQIVYSFQTSNYANQIYLQGTRRFTERDGVVGIPLEYHEPVKQYAAANFNLFALNNALTKTWINQVEYDQTLAYNPTMQ